MRRFEPLTEELWLPLQRHFISSCVRMRTNHLATKCNYYARLLKVGVRGVFEESLVWLMIIQPILHLLRGETCCSLIDGKLQLKHASAAKKSDVLHSWQGKNCST